MDHDEFSSREKKLNRKIISGSIVLVLTLSVSLMITLAKSSYDFIKIKSNFKDELVELDICHYGFKSIVSKEPSEALVEKGYLKILQAEDFNMIDFTVDDDSIVSVSMKEAGKCKLIFKNRDTGGHGLRSFIVDINKNYDYDFNFKVASISEIILDDSDLKWR